MGRLTITQGLVSQSFQHFQQCGGGCRECQVLWTSPWNSPGTIRRVVHSRHRAHIGGFHVHDDWLNRFWVELAERGEGVRVQVHTHPGKAFHSDTDDAYPTVQTPGFLSLVIPNFGMGAVSFEGSYLCEITETGGWREVPVGDRIVVVP